jgi:hypothetical protein
MPDLLSESEYIAGLGELLAQQIGAHELSTAQAQHVLALCCMRLRAATLARLPRIDAAEEGEDGAK